MYDIVVVVQGIGDIAKQDPQFSPSYFVGSIGEMVDLIDNGFHYLLASGGTQAHLRESRVQQKELSSTLPFRSQTLIETRWSSWSVLPGPRVLRRIVLIAGSSSSCCGIRKTHDLRSCISTVFPSPLGCSLVVSGRSEETYAAWRQSQL